MNGPMPGQDDRRSHDRQARIRRSWQAFLDTLHNGHPSGEYLDVLDKIALSDRTRARWEASDRMLLTDDAPIRHEAHVLEDGRLVLISDTGTGGHAVRISLEEWWWLA